VLKFQFDCACFQREASSNFGVSSNDIVTASPYSTLKAPLSLVSLHQNLIFSRAYRNTYSYHVTSIFDHYSLVFQFVIGQTDTRRQTTLINPDVEKL